MPKHETQHGLAACTPGPYEAATYTGSDKPCGIYGFSEDDGPDEQTMLLADFDNVNEDEVGEPAMKANAQLFAHAYDHALLLWAIMTHRIITIVSFDHLVLAGTTYPYERDSFGLPVLTPELREALRACLDEENSE